MRTSLFACFLFISGIVLAQEKSVKILPVEIQIKTAVLPAPDEDKANAENLPPRVKTLKKKEQSEVRK
ncbi:hypothetical protein [uncultured Eudoraea sp.]|uniref:hypothetical protein n=1 Tax=uncultured Eudoraea sp. TaxID=1035614 RepID=UPI00261F46DD|nr:hypothetical protein [uncultured Eudoraea sp.]